MTLFEYCMYYLRMIQLLTFQDLVTMTYTVFKFSETPGW